MQIKIGPIKPTSNKKSWPRIYSTKTSAGEPNFIHVYLAQRPVVAGGPSEYMSLTTGAFFSTPYNFKQSTMYVHVETPVQVTFNP